MVPYGCVQFIWGQVLVLLSERAAQRARGLPGIVVGRYGAGRPRERGLGAFSSLS